MGTLVGVQAVGELQGEFEVARNFLRSSPPDDAQWTMKQVIKARQKFSIVFLLYSKLSKSYMAHLELLNSLYCHGMVIKQSNISHLT